MQMRLGGIAGISAPANFLSLLHRLAGFHPHEAALQMRQQTVFAVRMLDQDGISRDAPDQLFQRQRLSLVQGNRVGKFQRQGAAHTGLRG